jgi:hypothetical protein
MPVLPRVLLAHAKIAHWVMNRGYKIKNGGLGTVSIMVKAQPMLRNQAKISSTHRTGFSRQSSLM